MKPLLRQGVWLPAALCLPLSAASAALGNNIGLEVNTASWGHLAIGLSSPEKALSGWLGPQAHPQGSPWQLEDAARLPSHPLPLCIEICWQEEIHGEKHGRW